MRKQNSPLFSDQTKLRQKAETLLKTMLAKNTQIASQPDIMKEIHELQVHQIELELQNEELLLTKERAEIAENKYTELYESAPSGYLTLSKEGTELQCIQNAEQRALRTH